MVICNNISHIRTYRSIRAVPNMSVFCSSLTSCLPSTSLRYFLNNLEVGPVAPTLTDVTTIYTPRNTCFCFINLLYIKLLPPSYITSSTNRHNSSLSRTVMSCLLVTVLLHFTSVSNMVTLLSSPLSACFAACSYRCSLPNFYPYFLAYI